MDDFKMETTYVAKRAIRIRELLLKYRDEFQLVFKRNLNRYMSPVTGFDIVKFDDDVVVKYIKKGKSTADTIKEKWGGEVLKMIEDLLNIEK